LNVNLFLRAKELELKLTAVTEELDRKNLELGKVLLGFASYL
jgi:hypothetical protein